MIIFLRLRVRIRETDHFFPDFIEYRKQLLFFRVRINTKVFLKYRRISNSFNFVKILTITEDINKRVFLPNFFQKSLQFK